MGKVANKIKEIYNKVSNSKVGKKVKEYAESEAGKKNIAKGKEIAINEGKKIADKGVEKLKEHATKHLTNWHSKAGEHGGEFLKHVGKHVKSLM